VPLCVPVAQADGIKMRWVVPTAKIVRRTPTDRNQVRLEEVIASRAMRIMHQTLELAITRVCLIHSQDVAAPVEEKMRERRTKFEDFSKFLNQRFVMK